MIVITILGTIAFAIGASTVSSLRRQSQIEDSQNAYQAAVSGLEDGLMRWRFNKDTETPLDRAGALKPFEGGKLDCEPTTPVAGATYTRPTTSTNLYDRIDLSADPSKGEKSVTYCIDPDKTQAPDPTHIVYDIKIQYKKDPGEAEVITTQKDTSGKDVPALAKDQVVEYDISELAKGASRIDLGIILKNYSRFDTTQNLEVAAFRHDGTVVGTVLYNPFLLNTARTGPIAFPPVGHPTFTSLVGVERIRLRPFGQDAFCYALGSRGSLRSSSGQQCYEPTGVSGSSSIDSRLTRVTVTGYYGVSKRKLQLTLDRASGSILPVFDYALFADQSDIKNP